MKSDLVDIQVAVHVTTKMAVLVSTDGERSKAVWLPRSQIEISKWQDEITVTMPERLAVEKGLV
jgi:hypothetical protein